MFVVVITIDFVYTFQRRLGNAAKKALSKIPTKSLKSDDKVFLSDPNNPGCVPSNNYFAFRKSGTENVVPYA